MRPSEKRDNFIEGKSVAARSSSMAIIFKIPHDKIQIQDSKRKTNEWMNQQMNETRKILPFHKW